MKFGISLMALMVGLSLAGCDNPQQKEARAIKRGVELFNDGQYEKARVEFKNAVRDAPTAAEPRYRLGLVDETEGDLRNAFGNFSIAEQQDDHFSPAKLKIAQYFMAAEQYEQARKRIETVLAATPDDAEAHALDAALLLREKDLDGAEKEAHAALAKDPANVSGTAALTGIYSAKEQYDKADAALTEGINRNPQNLSLLMLRVLLHEHMNDLPGVADAYQVIFKLKPDEVKFRSDLATIYVKAGKVDEAEATLRAGVAALPGNWQMKHQLVVFLSEHRGMDAAEKEIKDLMQANPNIDEPYFWLADLYITHGDADHAEALLNQIVDRGASSSPAALNARTLLARIDIKRGNRDLAQKLIAAVLAKKPDNSEALFVRANLEVDAGAYQSAVSDLRTIVGNAPKNEGALQLLGEALLLQGHTDLAIDTMQKAADLNPSNFAARVRLAQMVGMNGDPKQAMNLITLVTKAAPDYPIGWEAAARLALANKQWLPAEEAIHTLDKFEGQHLTAAFLEGQMMEANGKNEEALAKYTEVINANPSTPLAEHALRALIGAYHKLNKMEAAAAYIETLKTDSPFVATMLGEAYAATNKMEQAATAFDRAIAANAAFQEPYLDRAHIYLSNRQAEPAIEILKKAALISPGDFRAPMLEAELLGAGGKYQEAIALYDDILARNPALDAAANNLAEVIADYEFNDSAALEKARQVAERFSNQSNPLLLDTLAWVYFRQGNVPQAQTIMERAMAQDRDNKLPPQVHYHYAMILLKGGKTAEAKAELQKAVVEGNSYPGIEEAKKLLAAQ